MLRWWVVPVSSGRHQPPAPPSMESSPSFGAAPVCGGTFLRSRQQEGGMDDLPRQRKNCSATAAGGVVALEQ